MMVGGEKAAYDRIHPLLLDIGPKATYEGPKGYAMSMKIAPQRASPPARN